MKNKKIIIITSVIITLIILVTLGIILFNNSKKSKNEIETSENSKVLQIYNKLKQSKDYQITKVLNEDNQVTTIISNNKAYKEQKVNGDIAKYYYEDNVMYFLIDYNKTYYSYQNNDMIYYENILAFEGLTKMTHTKGKEKINKKTYEYEEYEGIQLDEEISSIDETKAKTRLYFDGDELKYIKIIYDDKEEIFNIRISYDIDKNKVQMLSDYTNAELQ